MTDTAYFRWLGFFVTVLGVSQMGWIVYFLTPARREVRRSEMKYLSFRNFSSPNFKYRYQEESATGTTWQEKSIQPEEGEKILSLLRGAKSLSLAFDEYRQRHPELAGALICPEIGRPVGGLIIFERESDTPSFTIDFLDIRQVEISAPGRETRTFVIGKNRYRELDEVTADIQWGPIPKDEPPSD
jgi:hypothetical protein